MNNLNPFNMSWLLMSQKTCSSQVHSNITRAMHAALRFFSRRRCVTSSTNLALSWAAAHACYCTTMQVHHGMDKPRYAGGIPLTSLGHINQVTANHRRLARDVSRLHRE
jgi:hypothetical protein